MRARIPLLVVVLAAALLTMGAAGAAERLGLTAHQQSLRSKVDRADGGPRPGGDPSRQRQTPLAEAASKSGGIGARGGKPARAVKPAKAQRRPADVLPNPRTTSRLASGCVLGYGAPGAQCVPARAPGNKPLTCAYVVKIFPKGVRVTGRDVLLLDTNRDGLACGSGDRDVPRASGPGPSERR